MKVSRKGKSNKIKIDYTLVDAYKYYKENSLNPVSYSKFKEFLLGEDLKSGLIEYVKKEILLEGFPLFLAARTGDISILKNEPRIKFKNGRLKNLPIDWFSTKKLWEEDPKAAEKKTLIYHENKHTRGFIYKVRWDTFTANFKGKSVYKFRMVREFNRILAPLLKDKKVDYRTIG